MVYIDKVNIRFGRMTMNHLFADSTQELLEMADKIGVAHKWIQYPGTGKEHFDICLSKKKMALEYGAHEIGWRKSAELSTRKFIPTLKSTAEGLFP